MAAPGGGRGPQFFPSTAKVLGLGEGAGARPSLQWLESPQRGVGLGSLAREVTPIPLRSSKHTKASSLQVSDDPGYQR